MLLFFRCPHSKFNFTPPPSKSLTQLANYNFSYSNNLAYSCRLLPAGLEDIMSEFLRLRVQGEYFWYSYDKP